MSTTSLSRLYSTIEQADKILESVNKSLTTLTSPTYHDLISIIPDHVSISICTDATIFIFLNNLPGFTTIASPSLAELLDIFNQFVDGESFDDPTNFSRIYTFKIPPNVLGPSPVTIKITAYLAESSELCRRVVIGMEEYNESITRPATRPIYGFEC